MPTHITGALSAVTATSSRDAWTVGSTSSQRTVILHWNGRVWTRTPTPDPGKIIISGLAATSPGNAWAVGLSGPKTAILRWDGRRWRQVHSPSSPSFAQLFGVTAGTPRTTWAVGTIGASDSRDALILHWNGTKWSAS